MSKKSGKGSPRKEARRQKELEQSIIKVFHRNPTHSFNYKQIGAKIGKEDLNTREKIIVYVKQLVEKGEISATGEDTYRMQTQGKYISGKLDFTGNGAAYLVPDERVEGIEDIFIPHGNTGTAMQGDTVEVYYFRRKPNRRPEGEVVELIRRDKMRFVGQLQRSEFFGFFIPDNSRVPKHFFIPKDSLMDAKNGDKVVAELVEWSDPARNPIGKIVDVLGTPGEHNVEMHSILAEYNLPYKFTEEVERYADSLPLEIPAEEIKKRRDMRGVTTFTIDPADAKDFDDALSVRKLENGNFEIGIHIADVSHYVKPGTILDDEAYDRGTSVYLVDRVVPMLPEVLSNGVCSLRPNEDKLTFSVVVEMTDDASIVNTWFGRTVTHSDRKFAYEDAQLIIETEKGYFKEEILALDRLAKIMRGRRMKSGAISFDRAEVKFKLDEQNEPVGVYFKESKDSNKLIEEFMLLANRSVATLVGRQMKEQYNGKAPVFIYRVHDKPNPEKLATLAGLAKQFGYRLNLKDPKDTAKSINVMLEKSYNTKEANMLETLSIRSMAKAEYSTVNIGHYGLAFDYYSHFTSPIRRYPDVMAHRLLQDYLDRKPSAKQEEYEDRCKYTSQRERLASDAERDSTKYMQVKYMVKQGDMEFKGVISGVTEWGMYVEIIENKCEGLIRIRDFKDDYYSFDAKTYSLVGENSKNIFRLGDEVIVKLKNADLERKTIDFTLVGTVDE